MFRRQVDAVSRRLEVGGAGGEYVVYERLMRSVATCFQTRGSYYEADRATSERKDDASGEPCKRNGRR
jgi:hypothetical protein